MQVTCPPDSSGTFGLMDVDDQLRHCLSLSLKSTGCLVHGSPVPQLVSLVWQAEQNFANPDEYVLNGPVELTWPNTLMPVTFSMVFLSITKLFSPCGLWHLPHLSSSVFPPGAV